ncbi:MAG TPA: hypothetical protein VM054_11005 [bacterium]|nr:hypothetical protein [bacterium]
MTRIAAFLLATLGALLLGCVAEPLPGGETVTWGLVQTTAPNAEWVRVPAEDALYLRRYYRCSLLGEFKLYYAGDGFEDEYVIRSSGTEARFLESTADLLREQIDRISPRAALDDGQPTLCSEPYLAVQYTYHDETAGEAQFHLDRLYFVENRYWFLDTGCLAEEEELVRPEIEALVASIVFPRFSEGDRGGSADGSTEEMSEEEIESLTEMPQGWNL